MPRPCPKGRKTVKYWRWVADPDSEARNDPDEICTRRNGKTYRADARPKIPAHYGCTCKYEYSHFRCVKG